MFYTECIQQLSKISLGHEKRIQALEVRYTAIICLYCENVWIENEGGTDNNPKPDLDNINGQITILNQILIISMHVASLVKRPCHLLKLSSRYKNKGMSRADNSIKI